ncbi:PAS domain S-box protein [Methylobacterium terricola]|uniref:histidine kinase n=1 Tax=Methylobacterium terricola TaxID=2583531 RepID=A0A5C4LR31_9HYPH|nr:PAS domain-containing hybrid sensor histidine kinase/response regulator [Methylobacterium terricola]TNC16225.1 PAS domain S-box protein [Methylobacterium terricola]
MTARTAHPFEGIPVGGPDEALGRALPESETGMAGLPSRLLLDALPQKIWMLDRDGIVQFANRAVREIGSSLGEPDGWDSVIHPKDRARAAAARASAIKSGQPYDLTIRLRDTSGRWHWHQTDLVPIREGASLTGWMMSAADVDDVVADNQALEATTNLLLLTHKAAGVGLWDWNMRTGALSLSAEGARLHGLSAQACIITSSAWTSLVHADDRAMLWDAVTKAVTTRTPFSVDVRVTAEHGGVRWIQSLGRVLDDAQGLSGRIVGLTLDITARKRAEQSLANAKEGAEKANRAKSDFLAMMSHEIRNPLNAVLGYTELMLTRSREPETLRHLAAVQEAGEILIRVVDDVLDVAQIEAGQVALDPEAFLLADLLEGTAAVARGAASRKGVAVEVLRDPATPTLVLGDVGRLRQVLLNLLTNAVKFTPAGRVVLAVSPETGRGGEGRLLFTVSDTGIGMSAAQQERLFVPFGQGDESIRRRFGGSGLGLVICRHLVELMGGQIGVTSEPGRGTRIWFAVMLPPA